MFSFPAVNTDWQDHCGGVQEHDRSSKGYQWRGCEKAQARVCTWCTSRRM